MQKIERSSKKKYLAITLIIALVIIGGLAFLYTKNQHSKPTNTIDYGKPTKAQQDQGNITKSQAAKNGDTSTKTQPGADQPPSPTPVPGSSTSNVGMTITSANQNNPVFQVRTLIDTTVNSGACNLTMTHDGSPTITQSAGVQALASTSTCRGFDVPMDQLAPGIWTITVNYNDTNLTGSASKQVTVH